jgi:hypothetical protein
MGFDQPPLLLVQAGHFLDQALENVGLKKIIENEVRERGRCAVDCARGADVCGQIEHPPD